MYNNRRMETIFTELKMSNQLKNVQPLLIFVDCFIQPLLGSSITRNVVGGVDVEMHAAFFEYFTNCCDGHPYHCDKSQCRQRPYLIKVILQWNRSILERNTRIDNHIGKLEQILL